jgi:hypothetical protein
MVSVPNLVGAVDITRVQKTQHCCVHKSSGTKQTVVIEVKAVPLHARGEGGIGSALITLNLGAGRA